IHAVAPPHRAVAMGACSTAPRLQVARQRGGGVDIRLLPFDAPVAQLIDRDLAAGHGAAHEAARREDLEIAIEIAKPRLAAAPSSFNAVHGFWLSCSPDHSDPTSHGAILACTPIVRRVISKVP